MADETRPPEPLTRAVALLESGAWQEAHAIVQEQRSELAAWLHGIAHTIEGDLENARYWYRRARRAFPGPEAVATEIAQARHALEGGAGRAKAKT